MRSSQVKVGSTRAAHRSLFYALGFSEEELKKPMIAVVNAQSEIIAGHAHLDDQAKMVKYGILAAGGVPVEVPAIGICDGIAMGHEGMKYPLASRELVADSVESVSYTHLDVYKRQIHPLVGAGKPPPDIAASVYHRNFQTAFQYLFDLPGNGIHYIRVNSVPSFAGQCFTAQFQNHAFVLGLIGHANTPPALFS